MTLAARRSACRPARPRPRSRRARARARAICAAASRFCATHSASVRALSAVAASVACASARMPAVSAIATIASATRISTSVKPRRASHGATVCERDAVERIGGEHDARVARGELEGERLVAAGRAERHDDAAASTGGPRTTSASASCRPAARARASTSSSSPSGCQRPLSGSRRQKRQAAPSAETPSVSRAHLRARGRVLERAGEPARLAHGALAIAAVEGEHARRSRDREDREHDQDLDQREAARAGVSQSPTSRCRRRCRCRRPGRRRRSSRRRSRRARPGLRYT